jgi:hypothetical protein
MKNFKNFGLHPNELKTIKGGTSSINTISTPATPSSMSLAQDFNTARSNREKGTH